MSRSLLILRPEPGASETARAAARLGLKAEIRSLFTIGAVGWEAPDPDRYDALMMTSANAARMAGERLHLYAGLPLYAVGGRTAAALAEAGLPDARIGPGDAQGLAAMMAGDGRRRILHPCGADRRDFDPGTLQIDAIEVYRANIVDPPPGFADAAGHVALLHSPRAARIFAGLAPAHRDVRIAAISTATAEAAGEGWAARAVAVTPDDAALLAAAAGLCQ